VACEKGFSALGTNPFVYENEGRECGGATNMEMERISCVNELESGNNYSYEHETHGLHHREVHLEPRAAGQGTQYIQISVDRHNQLPWPGVDTCGVRLGSHGTSRTAIDF